MNKYDIARVAHEVNKAYCEAMGDFSQQSWYEASSRQRELLGKKVESCLGATDADKQTLPNAWNQLGIAVHASMEDKVKDSIFRGVVAALRRYLTE